MLESTINAATYTFTTRVKSNMKVLYIGHYRENSGWAKVAEENILALDAIGVKVVPRCVELGSASKSIHPRITELEKKPAEGCDYCIQHILPHHLDYSGKFKKNVAFVEYECGNMWGSKWPNYLSMMDEVWTPGNWSPTLLRNVPLRTIHHCVDSTKYKRKLPKPNLPNSFKFYFVGEFIPRKNYGALLRCFHAAFTPSDNVDLVIKTSKHGMNAAECHSHFMGFANEVKRRMKLYPRIEDYKEEIVITERLTEEEILGLHAACDVFVCTSFGEACCLPLMDAIGMEKPYIIPYSMTEYAPVYSYSHGGIAVETHTEHVNSMVEDTFQDLYTGLETWERVDEMKVIEAMRALYDDQKYYNDCKAELTKLNFISNFDRKVVGEEIRKALLQ